MKTTLFNVALTFLFSLTFVIAQTPKTIFPITKIESTQTNNNSIAAQLNKIFAAKESGDEILYSSLIQTFKLQYPDYHIPDLILTQETADEIQSYNKATDLQQRNIISNTSSTGTHFHVVPPEYATTAGNATFVGPLANTARTYQLLIHDSLLTNLVGKKLIALSWRLPTAATTNWPVTDGLFTSYDIYLSESVLPSQRSFTFTQNIVGIQTKVRGDSLKIPIDSYLFGGTPNPWGPEITFTPWQYSGGHLLIEIRHSGSTATSRSVDAIGTSVIGYGTLFSGTWQSGYTATSGVQGNFSTLRLTFDIGVSVELPASIPEGFELSQNFPNPFNPKTTIDFATPYQSFVTIKIYDVLGKEIGTLVSQDLSPGCYSTQWDAESMPSGVYVYRLQAGGFSQTKKLMLIR